MSAVSERYALRDGDHWWFYLRDVRGELKVTEEGRKGQTWTPMVKGELAGWWRTPEGYAAPSDPNHVRIDVVSPPQEELKHYERVLDVVDVETYPSMLTPEEYIARAYRYDDDGDERVDVDPKMKVLYLAVHVTTEPTRAPLEHGPWLVLEGAPPEKDGLSWTASLPFELRERPEYRHLFDGHLSGFRKALAVKLSGVPGVKAYDSSHPMSVFLEVLVPRPDPVKWQVPPGRHETTQRGRREAARRARSAEQKISRHLELNVPDWIQGPNRAVAVETWNGVMDEYVSAISAMVANVCPTCKGHGWVEGKDNQPESAEAAE